MREDLVDVVDRSPEDGVIGPWGEGIPTQSRGAPDPQPTWWADRGPARVLEDHAGGAENVIESPHPQVEVRELERWERRARKLESKRNRMKVSGRSLITVIQPVIMKRAQEARRAGKAKEPPARDAA